jgi:hypothetical protein
VSVKSSSSSASPLLRQSRRRAERRTVLVVGEARITEPEYFHRLKLEDRVRVAFSVTVKKGRGGSRLQVVQEAVNRKNEPGAEYDESWCVMDVENPNTIEGKRDLMDALALARREGISVCLSNPAIEVWFLAHFERTCKYFVDCDAVIVDLDRLWRRDISPNGYSKTDEKIYERLHSRMEYAVRNARDVRTKDHREKIHTYECNSSTDMYLLVARLLGS